MNKNFTFACKLCTLFTIFSLNVNAITAQQCNAPAMTWKNPVLLSGTALQVNSIYKFSEVTQGVYALITIEAFVNGATLTNIDDSIFGYNAAWQPVVKTPATTLTTSYVDFKIEF